MSSSASQAGPKPWTIPSDTLAEFQSNPWTSSLLGSSDYVPIETTSRRVKPLTGEDTFFAERLGAHDAVPHLLTLRQRKPVPPPSVPPSLPPPPARLPATKRQPELITLLRLGNPGISGHPNTAHGGVIATLLDEIMSIAVSVHVPEYDFDGPANRARIYTSQLDVRFLRPVYVPATAVIKAWCVARDGRKFWMRGQLIQEDGLDGKEGEGMGGSIEAVRRKRVCAEAVGFWVMTREQKI